MESALEFLFKQQIIHCGLRIMFVTFQALLGVLFVETKLSDFVQDVVIDWNRMFPNNYPVIWDILTKFVKLVRSHLLKRKSTWNVG